MMSFDRRIYNFAAGPATLPEEVLEQARDELLNWQGLGTSVMEISHRSKEFMAVYEKTLADLRELMAIPSDYEILLLQGGGIGQNAAIPMNLMPLASKPKADFVVTGIWSEKSVKEAQKYGEAHIAASSQDRSPIKAHGPYPKMQPMYTFVRMRRSAALNLLSFQSLVRPLWLLISRAIFFQKQ
jgi:phosphoserine aminotransferase